MPKEVSGVKKYKSSEKIEKIIKKTVVAFSEFVTAFLLSSFRIFDFPSPFGIAFFAAFPKKSLAAFFGAFLGYLKLEAPEFFLTALVLTILKAVVFTKDGKYSKLFFSFAVTAFLAAAQLVKLAVSVFDASDVIKAVAFSLIAGAFSVIISYALENKSSAANRFSTVMLCSLFSAALSAVSGRFDLGTVLAVLLVLVAANRGKLYFGTVYGVMTGCFLSLISQSLLPLAAFSVGGMVAGALSNANKAFSASAMVFSLGIFSIFGGDPLFAMGEAVVAGGIFIFLSNRLLVRLGERIAVIEVKNESAAADFLKEKLLDAQSVLKETARIKEESEPYKKAEQTVCEVEEKVCAKCKKRFVCYGRKFDETNDIFYSLAFEKMNGYDNSFKKELLSKRCESAEKIMNYISRNTCVLEREKDGYRDAAEIISSVASNIKIPETDVYLKRYLEEKGEKEPETAVITENGAKKIILKGKTAILPEKKQLENEISEIYKTKFRLISEEREDGYKFVFINEPKFKTVYSSAAEGKGGNEICGDSVLGFETKDGKYYAIISDGMGSGAAAKADSLLTVKLLKTMLSKSFDGKTAMRAVNSALARKNETASFATVDMLAFNLHNGKAEFIKSGAAPSFVKRGNTVYEIMSSTLPAGLSSGGEYDKTSFTLKNGDLVIMMSDGVFEGFSDVRGEIMRMQSISPYEICKRLISAKSNDDKSVSAIKITLA